MAEAIVTMIRSGIPTHLIYAYIRTGGIIVTEDNHDVWSKEELAAWDAAIDEYDSKFPNPS